MAKNPEQASAAAGETTAESSTLPGFGIPAEALGAVGSEATGQRLHSAPVDLPGFGIPAAAVGAAEEPAQPAAQPADGDAPQKVRYKELNGAVQPRLEQDPQLREWLDRTVSRRVNDYRGKDRAKIEEEVRAEVARENRALMDRYTE